MKLTIALLTAIMAIGGAIFEITSWKTLNIGKRIFLTLAVLLAVLLCVDSILNISKEKEQENINSKIGDLLTPNVYKPEIRIINSRVSLSMNNSVNLNNFSCLVKDEKLLINFVAYDLQGKAIAVIENSRWKRYDQENYEINNDDHGFEIVTPDKRVVFQVNLENKKAYVGGFILDENGNGFYVFGNGPDAIIKKLSKDNSIPIPRNLLRPIFMYPRERNIGKRADNTHPFIPIF